MLPLNKPLFAAMNPTTSGSDGKEIRIGQRRSYDGALCTIRYIGQVAGTSGSWLGVEWDDPTRGKHDGQHKEVRYFSCNSKSPTAASFVRPTRPADVPQTFVSALQHKYVADVGHGAASAVTEKPIIISGKVAEEVGFDKIRRQQAQLSELKIVVLDGARVYRASNPPDERPIGQICPKVVELDISRNLLEQFGDVVDICSQLELLRILRVNGNRFQNVQQDAKLQDAHAVFKEVRELAIGENQLSWEDICHIAARFPALTSLFADANHLSTLSPIPPGTSFTSTLVSLNLECNALTSLADVTALTAIQSLRNLTLKGNRISDVVPSPSVEAPVFGSNLHYLDISYNQVTTWTFIDSLPALFPGLVSLRFAHNPIYDNPDLDDPLSSGSTSSTSTKAAGAATTDEAFMLLLGRLPTIRTLNFSNITAADRTNAEMYYLSRIARQLSAVPESSEDKVLKRHRRWAELCELYGEPTIVRQRDVNPNFLEARLITVHFHLSRKTEGDSPSAKRTVQIPKSFDIYAVKGIAGKCFGLPPLRLRLVWETGEWDPVAGFDDDAGGDSSDDEELEVERERLESDAIIAQTPSQEQQPSLSQPGRKAGRWVKREVELKDGPRQFGYCVDGLEVKIRVEMR